ncbi:hypothetical protein OG723_02705 [Streptomyces sp. NBC_01278]|uniref:hypothetical protein n=1 Tax=Streptomyces sp. NBC_01278 TaxID=2903809 RepID=UPI002E351A65|nr:hypothetical protein [Streptomyces sp. NBC_01278]
MKAILSLNVEDLDLDDRRARSGRTRVSWRSGTAGLRPRLPASCPGCWPAGPGARIPLRPAARPGTDARPGDLRPETGRRRLSYERAEYPFESSTEPLDPAGNGYTLRQLKPRADPGQDPAPRHR